MVKMESGYLLTLPKYELYDHFNPKKWKLSKGWQVVPKSYLLCCHAQLVRPKPLKRLVQVLDVYSDKENHDLGFPAGSCPEHFSMTLTTPPNFFLESHLYPPIFRPKVIQILQTPRPQQVKLDNSCIEVIRALRSSELTYIDEGNQHNEQLMTKNRESQLKIQKRETCIEEMKNVLHGEVTNGEN